MRLKRYIHLHVSNLFSRIKVYSNTWLRLAPRVRLAQSPARQSGTMKRPCTRPASQLRSTRPCSPSRTSTIARLRRSLQGQRANFRQPNYRVWETQMLHWKVEWIKRKLYSIAMKNSNSSILTLLTWARCLIIWFQTRPKRASSRAFVPIWGVTRQELICNLLSRFKLAPSLKKKSRSL